MPPPRLASVDPLSHALGRIENSLEIVIKTQSEDRLASATYRTEMRRDFTVARENMIDLKNRVNETADQLAEIRPDVADYKRRLAEGIGAWNTVKTLWAIVFALGATGIGMIVHAFWPTR